MVLDGITVLFDTALMAVTVGAVLLFAGTRATGDKSLCLWGAGYMSGAIATALFTQRGELPNIWTIDIANAALALAYGFFWAGARRFGNQSANPFIVSFGAAVWVVACRIDAFYTSGGARIALSSVTIGVYLIAICWTLLRIKERLPSKLPLIGVFALHACVFLARLPLLLVAPPHESVRIVVTPMFFAVAIEGLFHLVASSILLVTMSKERSENGVQHLASTDALTGVSNRRSFMEQGTHRLRETVAATKPLSVLMIDIDHFKTINDTRGHQQGDEVLQAVAQSLRNGIRPTDLCGRLGGEEFACILFNCTGDQGQLIAERLRADIMGGQLGVTVSVGVASAPSGQASALTDLLTTADRALYASKGEGRNRVTLALAA